MSNLSVRLNCELSVWVIRVVKKYCSLHFQGKYLSIIFFLLLTATSSLYLDGAVYSYGVLKQVHTLMLLSLGWGRKPTSRGRKRRCSPIPHLYMQWSHVHWRIDRDTEAVCSILTWHVKVRDVERLDKASSRARPMAQFEHFYCLYFRESGKRLSYQN